MTTTPKPAPASDEEIERLRGSLADTYLLTEGHDPRKPSHEWQHFYTEAGTHMPAMLQRHIADRARARIREQAEENERLRSALINLRAKCLEMGWEPRSPQLMDAAAALSKPEPRLLEPDSPGRAPKDPS